MHVINIFVVSLICNLQYTVIMRWETGRYVPIFCSTSVFSYLQTFNSMIENNLNNRRRIKREEKTKVVTVFV